MVRQARGVTIAISGSLCIPWFLLIACPFGWHSKDTPIWDFQLGLYHAWVKPDSDGFKEGSAGSSSPKTRPSSGPALGPGIPKNYPRIPEKSSEKPRESCGNVQDASKHIRNTSKYLQNTWGISKNAPEIIRKH